MTSSSIRVYAADTLGYLRQIPPLPRWKGGRSSQVGCETAMGRGPAGVPG